jgi:thiamine-monophosphate kinase
MLSEFEFIDKIRKKYSLTKIGDDCAILPKDEKTDLLLTSDMLVENIDFRLDWTTPEFLGHKALAVSLSDIAAMGGNPTFSMLTIAIPELLWKTDFLDRFYSGWQGLAEAFSVELVGGDISKTNEHLVIDSFVMGEVPKGKALLRSGATAGDAVFVSGYVGGAAAGLLQLESGLRFSSSLDASLKHLLFRQLQPIPQVRTAITLREHGLASAMLDVSDGLSSDLGHLMNTSGVGCHIEFEKVPADPAIASLALSQEERADLALHGGEDFELLLTVRKENFSAVQDLGLHCIGEVNTNIGIIELIDGKMVSVLQPKGYRHF